MDLGLEGRCALVTGGSMGIGKAAALLLAAEGCRVAIAARGEQALAQAAGEIGGGALAVRADCTRPDEIRAMFDRDQAALPSGCYTCQHMRALIASANGFEESELLVPYYRLLEEGFEVDVASTRRGTIHGKHGYPVRANLSLRQAVPERYDLLVIPGGKAPHFLQVHPDALSLVKHFFEAGKPVAAICHGPEVLAAAGVLAGRRATGNAALARQLAQAGAFYEDTPLVVDGDLVTARGPADLPDFMRAVLRLARERRGDAAQLAAAAV